MIASVSKPKLAKGLSYVLKTSHMANALAAAEIDCHVDLVYWAPQGGGSILEGNYWLPNENVPYPRVYVRAGAVPSSARLYASEALLTAGLPAFVEWLKHIAASPGNLTTLLKPPYFNAAYLAEGLIISSEPVYKRRRWNR